MTQAQAQQQPKQQGPQWGEGTLFLCPDDDWEWAVSKAYLKDRYPGTPASLVREIPVDRLTHQHLIIPIFRPLGKTEAWQTIVASNGTEHLKKTDPTLLAKEVVEAEPLRVTDYWTVLASAGNGVAFASVAGTVQVNKLFGALSERLQDPISIKGWRADVRHLKIG